MRVTFLSMCLCMVNQVVLGSAQEINGDILARELNKVADSVGWSFLQVHLLIHLEKTFLFIFKFKVDDGILRV